MGNETPPTGLNVTNVSSGSDFVAATVSISDWGVGSGTRYRELQVWTYDFQNPRRYKSVTGDTMSGSITVNNDSSGSLIILPNTRYTVGGFATNGEADTGSQSFGTVVTVPAEPTIETTIVGKDYATFGYFFSDQGGYNTMYIDYKIGSGAWTTATTITGSGEKSGDFTVTGLSPSTEYIITPRVRSSDGWTKTMSSITITTTVPQTNLYCPVSGTAKRVTKMYFPWATLISAAINFTEWIIDFASNTFVSAVSHSPQATKLIGEGNKLYRIQIKAESNGGNPIWRMMLWFKDTDGISTGYTVDTANSTYDAKNMINAWGMTTRYNSVPVSGSSFITNFSSLQYSYSRKAVKKIYASVNDERKLAWEEP